MLSSRIAIKTKIPSATELITLKPTTLNTESAKHSMKPKIILRIKLASKDIRDIITINIANSVINIRITAMIRGASIISPEP